MPGLDHQPPDLRRAHVAQAVEALHRERVPVLRGHLPRLPSADADRAGQPAGAVVGVEQRRVRLVVLLVVDPHAAVVGVAELAAEFLGVHRVPEREHRLALRAGLGDVHRLERADKLRRDGAHLRRRRDNPAHDPSLAEGRGACAGPRSAPRRGAAWIPAGS